MGPANLCEAFLEIESKELFRSFYGKLLPQTNDVIKFFINNKITSGEVKRIFLAENAKEVFIIDRDWKKVIDLSLKIQNGKVGYTIRESQKTFKGQLFSERDEIGEKICLNLVAALVTFHGLTSRIALEEGDDLVYQYPFPSMQFIRKAISLIDLSINKEKLINHIRVLRNCLVAGGLFYFKTESEQVTSQVS